MGNVAALLEEEREDFLVHRLLLFKKMVLASA